MRKLLLLFVTASLLIACSKEELREESNLQQFKLVQDYGCGSGVSYDIEDMGDIQIQNDNDYLYITLQANPGYDLDKSRLQMGSELKNFPLVGKGNLPPGKMEISKKFPADTDEFTFQLPLSDSDNLLIACFTEFTSDGRSFSAWVGDHLQKEGNWKYLEYKIVKCDCYAGKDNSETLTESEAAALESWDEVRKKYLSLLDPGVNREGKFEPSIWDLIHSFQNNPIGTFTTKYTVETNECSDSVELSIVVVPD